MNVYQRFFINRVRDYLFSHRISQADVAKGIGISPARLSHYFNGRRAIPVDVCVRIAVLFKLDLNYLFGLKDGGRHGKS